MPSDQAIIYLSHTACRRLQPQHPALIPGDWDDQSGHRRVAAVGSGDHRPRDRVVEARQHRDDECGRVGAQAHRRKVDREVLPREVHTARVPVDTTMSCHRHTHHTIKADWSATELAQHEEMDTQTHGLLR